jgi:hypothetical protein
MSLIMDDFEDSDGEDDETLLSFSSLSDHDDTDLPEGVSDALMFLDSAPANPDRPDSGGTQSADSHIPGPLVNKSPPLPAYASLHEPSVAPPKSTIVIRDVAYTYYAMLYYVDLRSCDDDIF